MELYLAKNPTATDNKIVADDMILTKDLPTTAGSKMLDGYMSLFDAEVLAKTYEKGFSLAGKANVGEFAIDLVGESSYKGAIEKDGKLVSALAEIVLCGQAQAGIALDVNGSVRRYSAQSGLVSLKPTYGVVSRFGTIPVACSGECVSVVAKTADKVKEVFSVIAGHDDKDGTSLPQTQIDKALQVTPVRKVAILKDLTAGIDEQVQKDLQAFIDSLKDKGVQVVEVQSSLIAQSRIVWNILMSAELCNNVSRYDGVKYGYRAKQFSGIDELYTNSRTEAFGKLLKSVILYGSDTLSTENYKKVYDKALRMRRLIVNEFEKLFADVDVIVAPATSCKGYAQATVNNDEYICYKENFYTAPASVTGLPAVVCKGVQVIGKKLSDSSLLELVKALDGEGK